MDYSPTFQKVDPLTGLTFYDFDGHIHADGLDLDASPTVVASNNSRVRWLSTTDGGLVAEMYAYDRPAVGGAGHLDIKVYSSDQDHPTGFELDAFVGAGGIDAVTARANTQTRMILDEQGRSAFAQVHMTGFASLTAYGPFVTSFASIPANNSAANNVALGNPILPAAGAFYVPLGYVADNGAGATVISWAMGRIDDSTAKIVASNNRSAAPASGVFDFGFLILSTVVL